MRLFVIFFLSLICISSNAANTKIGFIDTDRVVKSLSLYQKSIKALSQEFEPKKQELLDLFEHIELVKSNINLINNSSTPKTLKAELSKLSNLEQSFKQETEDEPTQQGCGKDLLDRQDSVQEGREGKGRAEKA